MYEVCTANVCFVLGSTVKRKSHNEMQRIVSNVAASLDVTERVQRQTPGFVWIIAGRVRKCGWGCGRGEPTPNEVKAHKPFNQGVPRLPVSSTSLSSSPGKRFVVLRYQCQTVTRTDNVNSSLITGLLVNKQHYRSHRLPRHPTNSFLAALSHSYTTCNSDTGLLAILPLAF
ncbi:hypothetical protein J6590_039531 [Homalodisca vitripennis]|nr:hypothetical protein J6590_039531 [Homalodisca vitripennis]